MSNSVKIDEKALDEQFNHRYSTVVYEIWGDGWRQGYEQGRESARQQPQASVEELVGREVMALVGDGNGFRILESSETKAFGSGIEGLTIQMYRPEWQFGIMSALVQAVRAALTHQGGKGVGDE